MTEIKKASSFYKGFKTGSPTANQKSQKLFLSAREHFENFAEHRCTFSPAKMIFEKYIPTPSLRLFIRNYLIIESQDERVNRVLPDTSFTLAFRFKGQVNYLSDNQADALPGSVLSGLRKSVRLIHYASHTSTLLVLFKAAGATAFFQAPLHELFEESVSLDHFIRPREISLIEEQLAEAKNNLQRIALLETFLGAKLFARHPDPLIFDAIQKIQASRGMIKMKALADTLYISQDAFEKRFRKTVGASPKQFTSIIRMKSVIHQKKPAQSLTDMALSAGYFDQPHFNKDFKLFTGQTPTDFFKSPSFW